MSREDAERRLRFFERGHGNALVRLASHAALPVVLDPDFVHLLRVNYFLDPPVTLPYAAEAELLLSPLCTEVDQGLYLIDPDLRDVLLQRLIEDYDSGRLQDVGRLLWEYGQRGARWSGRPGLPEAQQLSALNFIDPARAQDWLARAEEGIDATAATTTADRRWFVAMRKDLEDRAAAVERADEQARPTPDMPSINTDPGMLASRLVLVRYAASDGVTREGSGFLINNRQVLTSAHVADGSGHVILGGGINRKVSAILRSPTPTVDLAVLTVSEPAARLAPMGLAQVDWNEPTVIECRAIGFTGEKENRFAWQSTEIHGRIRTADNLDVSQQSDPPSAQLLVLVGGGLPGGLPPAPPGTLTGTDSSPWAGMSGAAVFADDRVIGVIHGHLPATGRAAFTVTPITAINQLPVEIRKPFLDALKIRDPTQLPVLSGHPAIRDDTPLENAPASLLDQSIFPIDHPDARALLSLLARSYDPRQAEMQSRMAGLAVERIDFHGAGLQVWELVLALAARTGRLRSLVRVIMDWAPENIAIRSLLERLLAEEPVQPASGDQIANSTAEPGKIQGHAFISYVREDSGEVNVLQRMFEAAGIRVWRDTDNLWPGEDWHAKIRDAITHQALAFIPCFSRHSSARRKNYQNEELLLAIEQLRSRPPDAPWLFPVRFDDCDIPDFRLGAGRTLRSIQHADLFGPGRDLAANRLLTAVQRLLQRSDTSTVQPASSDTTAVSAAVPTRNELQQHRAELTQLSGIPATEAAKIISGWPTDRSVAHLLTLRKEKAARIISECDDQLAGNLLSAIAASHPAQARTILEMLKTPLAGRLLHHMNLLAAASALSLAPPHEAARILAKADDLTTVGVLSNMEAPIAANLIPAMVDDERAVELLARMAPSTAADVLRNVMPLDRRQAFMNRLPEQFRSLVARYL